MKLRQKLAVVLASAMVVTAVPVVTMAKSTSYASKVMTVAKDGDFETNLVIDVKDSTTTTTQVIYLDITGAKFDETKVVTVDGFDVKVEEKTMVLTSKTGTVSGKITVPVYGIDLTGDEAVINIDGSGTLAVDNDKVVVAKKSDSKATVTAADAVKIDGEGTVANITIDEPFAGVLADKTITLTLENSNYKFISTGKGTTSKGLTDAKVTTAYGKNDDQVITVTLDKASKTPGRIVLEGIEVKCLDKNATPEDIQITVSGDKVTETTLTVAKVTEYTGELVLSDKSVAITAGQEKSVKVKLKETLADSFVEGKTVEFTIDKGYLTTTPGGKKDADGFYEDGVYKNEKDKKANELIGFTYVVESSKKDDKEVALDKEFELKIQTNLDESGEVTLTASGSRAIGDDLTLVVADVTPAIEVKATPMSAKSGVKDQKGGTLVITETAKGNIKAGETFQIELKDGVTFSGKPAFEVTEGDLVIDKIEVDKTTKSILNVTVKRASKTASTLTIKDFAINSDRTIADGSYAVELKGAALTKAGKIKVADFLKVGEKTSAVSAFTIGESYYVVDGVKVEMDAAPYIEDGRTMVPVKYVAAALGLDAKDIMWDQANKTVTVFADRTVQLKANSNVAVVNGAALTIDGKVVVKDGRTFVPVSQLGNLLGVTATWDAATKTATFKN